MPQGRSCVRGVPEKGTSCGLRHRRGFVLLARRSGSEYRFVPRPSDLRFEAELPGGARSEPCSRSIWLEAAGAVFLAHQGGGQSLALDGDGRILRARVVRRVGFLAADQGLLFDEWSQLLGGRRESRLGLAQPHRQAGGEDVDEQSASSRQPTQREVARDWPFCRVLIERARRLPRPGSDDCDGRLRRPPLALVGSAPIIRPLRQKSAWAYYTVRRAVAVAQLVEPRVVVPVVVGSNPTGHPSRLLGRRLLSAGRDRPSGAA